MVHGNGFCDLNKFIYQWPCEQHNELLVKSELLFRMVNLRVLASILVVVYALGNVYTLGFIHS